MPFLLLLFSLRCDGLMATTCHPTTTLVAKFEDGGECERAVNITVELRKLGAGPEGSYVCVPESHYHGNK